MSEFAKLRDALSDYRFDGSPIKILGSEVSIVGFRFYQHSTKAMQVELTMVVAAEPEDERRKG